MYGKPAKGWYHAHILINLGGVFPYVISFHNARRIGAVYHAAAIRKPGVSNLMTIYSTFTGKDLAAIEAEFAGKGYGDFKLAVAEVTADALAPVQTEYGRILADKAYVDSVLKSGAERAARLANRTVSKVYRKVGLMQLDK